MKNGRLSKIKPPGQVTVTNGVNLRAVAKPGLLLASVALRELTFPSEPVGYVSDLSKPAPSDQLPSIATCTRVDTLP